MLCNFAKNGSRLSGLTRCKSNAVPPFSKCGVDGDVEIGDGDVTGEGVEGVDADGVKGDDGVATSVTEDTLSLRVGDGERFGGAAPSEEAMR